MPLMNRAISNLFGGVSQQAAGVRADNQCEELVNAYPSITDGLVKRPPSEFITAISEGSALPEATPYYTISMDTGGLLDSAGQFLTYPGTKDLLEGDLVTISGFSNPLNNGVFALTAPVLAGVLFIGPAAGGDFDPDTDPEVEAEGLPITIELVT